VEPEKRVAERTPSDALFASLRHLPRSRWPVELLAGVTLLAIAVPEQLATSQLADVPSFMALLAFIVATIVFAMLGANPILSIGADSTIAPLFAVALVKLAAPSSPHLLELISATAVLAGVLVAAVGLFKLGWLADFLSAPIVAGFMSGVGITIMVHQLGHFLGLPDVSGSVIHRATWSFSHLNLTNGATLIIAAGTFVVVVVGERVSAKVPFALFAVVIATLVTHFGHLARHGVSTLSTVSVVYPKWRLQGYSWHDLAVVATTALTIAVVILSQSAATSRNAADELGIYDDVNRDFLAIGVANIASGFVGAIPVNASPARTAVVRASGGRTQLVGLVAAGGAILVGPLAPALKDVPLAVLAGILFFVAARLIKVADIRRIAKVNAYEFALALITGLAVIIIGVQEGIAVAVMLAIVDQTRRNARPRAMVLGRRPDSTSWEPLGREGAAPVDDVTVLLFTAPLFFANAALFRSEVHSAMRTFPETRHLVIDAAAMTDVDYTGLTALSSVVGDLARDKVDVVLARPSDALTKALAHAPWPNVHLLRTFGTVDEAVSNLTHGDHRGEK
jgi:MFS superfamily sulfate permease-like transporter